MLSCGSDLVAAFIWMKIRMGSNPTLLIFAPSFFFPPRVDSRHHGGIGSGRKNRLLNINIPFPSPFSRPPAPKGFYVRSNTRTCHYRFIGSFPRFQWSWLLSEESIQASHRTACMTVGRFPNHFHFDCTRGITQKVPQSEYCQA